MYSAVTVSYALDCSLRSNVRVLGTQGTACFDTMVFSSEHHRLWLSFIEQWTLLLSNVPSARRSKSLQGRKVLPWVLSKRYQATTNFELQQFRCPLTIIMSLGSYYTPLCCITNKRRLKSNIYPCSSTKTWLNTFYGISCFLIRYIHYQCRSTLKCSFM